VIYFVKEIESSVSKATGYEWKISALKYIDIDVNKDNNVLCK
jgi:hypothetical protein